MRPIDLLRDYAEVKNEHDVDEMIARTHPECRYLDVDTDLEVVGRSALRAYHQHLFAAVPDYAASLDGIAGEGDSAVAWGRFRGRLAQPLFGRGTAGDRLDVAAVFVCAFRDGLLHRERAHIDLTSLRRQLSRPSERFIEELTATAERPSASGVAALLTEDAVLHNVTTGDVVSGRRRIEAYVGGVLADDPGLTLRSTASAANGASVFVSWRTHRSSAAAAGVAVFRLRASLAEHCELHLGQSGTQRSGVVR